MILVILAAWHLGRDMMLFLGTGFGFSNLLVSSPNYHHSAPIFPAISWYRQRRSDTEAFTCWICKNPSQPMPLNFAQIWGPWQLKLFQIFDTAAWCNCSLVPPCQSFWLIIPKIILRHDLGTRPRSSAPVKYDLMGPAHKIEILECSGKIPAAF